MHCCISARGLTNSVWSESAVVARKDPVSSLCVLLRTTRLGYAQARARFRAGKIRALDSTGNVERTTSVNETARML